MKSPAREVHEQEFQRWLALQLQPPARDLERGRAQTRGSGARYLTASVLQPTSRLVRPHVDEQSPHRARQHRQHPQRAFPVPECATIPPPCSRLLTQPPAPAPIPTLKKARTTLAQPPKTSLSSFQHLPLDILFDVRSLPWVGHSPPNTPAPADLLRAGPRDALCALDDVEGLSHNARRRVRLADLGARARGGRAAARDRERHDGRAAREPRSREGLSGTSDAAAREERAELVLLCDRCVSGSSSLGPTFSCA